MAKIQIREETAKPTNYAMPNAGVAGSGGRQDAIRNEMSATRYMIGGMEKLSRTAMGIAEDMKHQQFQSEMIAGQIEYQKLTDSAMQTLEQERFEGKNNLHDQKTYEARFDELMNEADEKMNDWVGKNTSWKSGETRLYDEMKVRRTKLFSQAMGSFLKARQDEIVRMNQNSLDFFIAQGDMDSAEKVISSMSYLTPDTRKQVLREAGNKIDKNELSLRFAQAEELINPESKKELYVSILRDLDNGKYKGLYASESKKLISALKQGINKIDYKNEIISIKTALLKDMVNMSHQQFDEWEKSTIAGIESKKNLSSEEKDFYKEHVSSKRKELQSQFLENAQKEYKNATLSLLSSAYNSGNGDVNLSLDFIQGTELTKKRADIDSKENRYFAYGSKAQEYDKDFHSIMQDIDAYKIDKDKDGIELRGLLFRTQIFSREHRIMLINALNNRAKGIKPEKWSNESLDVFKAQIDSVFEWYDIEEESSDEKEQMLVNPKSVAFYQLRNSIIKDVETLGLSPLEAQDYLHKHPIYKRLKDKQSYADALNFLNGMADWQAPGISKEKDKGAGAGESKYIRYMGM